MMKHLIKIALVTALVGCGNPELEAEPKVTETCNMKTHCSIEKDRLESEKKLLAEHGIPFTESAQTHEGVSMSCYSVSGEYCEKVDKLFESVRGKKPPSCYSIGLEKDCPCLAEVEKEFSDKGVPIRRMDYDGKVYLVWPPEHQKKAIELGYAFEESLDPSNCES